MADEVKDVFVGLGSSLVNHIKYRDSWVFASHTGKSMASPLEKVSAPGLGYWALATVGPSVCVWGSGDMHILMSWSTHNPHWLKMAKSVKQRVGSNHVGFTRGVNQFHPH